jgi:hypothetical protein
LVAVANRRRFDGDATDDPFGQSKNENGSDESIVDGCQCRRRTEVLLEG